jgi:hypothetical protein
MNEKIFQQSKSNVIDRFLYDIWILPPEKEELRDLLEEEVYNEFINLGGSEFWWDKNFENYILQNLNYITEKLYELRFFLTSKEVIPWY